MCPWNLCGTVERGWVRYVLELLSLNDYSKFSWWPILIVNLMGQNTLMVSVSVVPERIHQWKMIHPECGECHPIESPTEPKEKSDLSTTIHLALLPDCGLDVTSYAMFLPTCLPYHNSLHHLNLFTKILSSLKCMCVCSVTTEITRGWDQELQVTDGSEWSHIDTRNWTKVLQSGL